MGEPLGGPESGGGTVGGATVGVVKDVNPAAGSRQVDLGADHGSPGSILPGGTARGNRAASGCYHPLSRLGRYFRRDHEGRLRATISQERIKRGP